MPERKKNQQKKEKILRLFSSVYRAPSSFGRVRTFAASTKKGRAAAKKAALTNSEEEGAADPENPGPTPAASATPTATKTTPLGLALRHIESTFGKGALMKLGAHRAGVPADVISTGSLSLDLALGIGGLPRGRVVEIYGPESSGKTTLALHVIAEAQKRGGKCTLIDAENALDPLYARSLGVNVDELYVSQPDCTVFFPFPFLFFFSFFLLFFFRFVPLSLFLFFFSTLFFSFAHGGPNLLLTQVANRRWKSVTRLSKVAVWM